MNITEIKVYKARSQFLWDVAPLCWVIDARRFDQPIRSELNDWKQVISTLED